MIRFYNNESIEDKKIFLENYKFLSNAYGISPKIRILSLKSRRDLEIKLKRKISHQEIGFCNRESIYILNRNEIIRKTVWKKKHLSSLYLHELVHGFNYALNKQRRPLWLEEGIASFFSGMNLNNFVQAAMKKNKLIDFERLFTEQQWNSKISILKYHQSGSFIGFIRNKYSFKKIIELKKKSHPNKKTFRENFKKIFKKDFVELVREWKRYIKESSFPKIKRPWLLDQIEGLDNRT